MAKRVICRSCGRSFRKGTLYYYRGGRYYCGRCARSHNRKVRQNNTGMKQSYLAMILKIFIGFLFLCSIFSKSSDAKEIIFDLILGIALIAWGLVPFIGRDK